MFSNAHTFSNYSCLSTPHHFKSATWADMRHRFCWADSLHGWVCHRHCLYSMWSRVYETVQCPSTCLSVCPIHPLQQRAVGFAAVGPAGDINQLLHGWRHSSTGPQHTKQQQMRAVPRFTVRCYASAVLAMGLSVSVCLSVTSRCSIKTAEWIELVLGMWASFHPFYAVLKGNSVISKNKDTFLWNFVLNSGLRKFRHGNSIVETCYQLSWERWPLRAR